VPANVTTEFSAHVADVENVEATAERPAFVRLTIEPSQKRRDPNWPGETRTFEADAVIGCDGVKSIVRKCIGATGPNGLVTRYTGTYVYRALIDSEKVRAVTGESVMTPLMYCGPDAVSRPSQLLRHAFD
jgi:2-polyprenyl-6-methoxyphenol hydroxylase-like FAD-dependent oxidoreductase